MREIVDAFRAAGLRAVVGHTLALVVFLGTIYALSYAFLGAIAEHVAIQQNVAEVRR